MMLWQARVDNTLKLKFTYQNLRQCQIFFVSVQLVYLSSYPIAVEVVCIDAHPCTDIPGMHSDT